MNDPKKHSKLNQLFIERLTSIIMDEMSLGKISLEMVASKMFITRGQLNRKVKAITGRTTQQFAMDIRLKNACNLLKNSPDIMISEVAYKCGFEEATSFSRAFHREYNTSPTKYRNENI